MAAKKAAPKPPTSMAAKNSTKKNSTPKKSGGSMADTTPAQKKKVASEKAYSTQMGVATRKAIFEYSKSKDPSKMGFIPGYVVKDAKAKFDKMWKMQGGGPASRKK